jgi:hypothetical protein
MRGGDTGTDDPADHRTASIPFHWQCVNHKKQKWPDETHGLPPVSVGMRVRLRQVKRIVEDKGRFRKRDAVLSEITQGLFGVRNSLNGLHEPD